MHWDFNSQNKSENWNKRLDATARKTVPKLVLFVINVLLEEMLSVISAQ